MIKVISFRELIQRGLNIYTYICICARVFDMHARRIYLKMMILLTSIYQSLIIERERQKEYEGRMTISYFIGYSTCLKLLEMVYFYMNDVISASPGREITQTNLFVMRCFTRNIHILEHAVSFLCMNICIFEFKANPYHERSSLQYNLYCSQSIYRVCRL